MGIFGWVVIIGWPLFIFLIQWLVIKKSRSKIDVYRHQQELSAITSELKKEIEKANELEETHYRVFILSIAEMLKHYNNSNDIPYLYKEFQAYIYNKVSIFFQEKEDNLRSESEIFSLGVLWGILRLSENMIYEDTHIWNRFRYKSKYKTL